MRHRQILETFDGMQIEYDRDRCRFVLVYHTEDGWAHERYYDTYLNAKKEAFEMFIEKREKEPTEDESYLDRIGV